jgi:hypothetical protein
MNKLVFSLLLFSSLLFSQTEKKVGDFYKVTTFDKIAAELIPSDENKVELSGINSNELEVVNRNGELKLRMPLLKILDGGNVSAKVYYVKLESVEANEGSEISGEAVFKTTAFEIIAKEGAKINVRLEVSKLTAKVVSGAIVTTEGSAKNQDLSISAGAIYDGKKLTTDQTVVSINAGGQASIFSTELVVAKVRAGGTITVYGNPKQVNQQTFAGGRIQVVK